MRSPHKTILRINNIDEGLLPLDDNKYETKIGICSTKGATNTNFGFLKASLRLAFKKMILIREPQEKTIHIKPQNIAAGVSRLNILGCYYFLQVPNSNDSK
jgi:hypothetical protein